MQVYVQIEEKQQYIIALSTQMEYAVSYFYVDSGINHNTLESFWKTII